MRVLSYHDVFCYTISMHTRPYVLNALKYATLTIAGIVCIIIVAYFLRGSEMSSLSGRLVPAQQTGEIPTQHVSTAQVMNGFLVPADTHVIFTIPGSAQPIPATTFVGGKKADQETRFWIYGFSGHEDENQEAGFTGRKLYDGMYYYSAGELSAQSQKRQPADNNLLAIRKSIVSPDPVVRVSDSQMLYPGQTYYIMSAGELLAGLDLDNDGINTAVEAKIGTDARIVDTDRDGISDGIEFVAGYNPREPDTDHDGNADGCEDANKNGTLDAGETSPVTSDTDRDGFCDGRGTSAGCPEMSDSKTLCSQDRDNQRVCRPVPSSPIYGEDANGNCAWDAPDETSGTNPATYGVDDHTFKENQFTAKFGIRPSGQGTRAPAFPIPTLPTR